MKEKNCFNIENLRKYFTIFMMYAVIGWCYEVFLEVIIYKWGFSNRGVLFGPYCPVYGVGALAFIFSVYPLIKNKTGWHKYLWMPVVFFLCMTIATAIELLTSYICEFFMGSWPWQTYANYKINFQARIALSPSIRFGIGGVVFLYFIQPFFEMICEKLGIKKIKVISIILAVIVGLDCIYTFLIK